MAIKLNLDGKTSKLFKFSIIKMLLIKKVVCAGILILPLQSNPKVSVPTALILFVINIQMIICQALANF